MTTSLNKNNNNYTQESKKQSVISDLNGDEKDDCKQRQISANPNLLVDSIEQDKLKNHILETSRKTLPFTETSNVNSERHEVSSPKNEYIARIECIHKTVDYSSDQREEEDEEGENYMQDEKEGDNYDKETQSDDSIEIDNNRNDQVLKENKTQKCIINRSQTNSIIKNSDSLEKPDEEEVSNRISTSPSCSVNGNNLTQSNSSNRNALVNSTSSSASSHSIKLTTSDVNIDTASTSPGSVQVKPSTQKPTINNSFLLKQASTSSINTSINPTSNKNNVNDKLSPGLAKRITTSPITSTVNTATNIKIQNALDRNMQKLNLARQTNMINSKIKAANLTKEEIELFTNSMQNNLNLNIENQNQFSVENYSLTAQNDRILHDTREAFSLSNKLSSSELLRQSTNNPAINQINQHLEQIKLNNQHQNILNQTHMIPESESYYLNPLPNNFLNAKNTKISNYNCNETPNIDNSKTSTSDLNKNPFVKSVILRNSTEREMTPDSIDDDTDINNKIKVIQKRKNLNNNISKNNKLPTTKSTNNANIINKKNKNLKPNHSEKLSNSRSSFTKNTKLSSKNSSSSIQTFETEKSPPNNKKNITRSNSNITRNNSNNVNQKQNSKLVNEEYNDEPIKLNESFDEDNCVNDEEYNYENESDNQNEENEEEVLNESDDENEYIDDNNSKTQKNEVQNEDDVIEENEQIKHATFSNKENNKKNIKKVNFKSSETTKNHQNSKNNFKSANRNSYYDENTQKKNNSNTSFSKNNSLKIKTSQETNNSNFDNKTCNKNRSIRKRESDTDEETNKLLESNMINNFKDEKYQENEDASSNGQAKYYDDSNDDENIENKKSKEILHQIIDPDNQVLIEGVLFRARYLGSTQLVTDGNPTKLTRMLQAQEAVGRIKAPEGESQPSVEVDLFVSTEKIMVLNTDLQEIMMDHSLRSISYIADIGNLVVLMAKRRVVPASANEGSSSSMDEYNNGSSKRPVKMICHVFESDEAQIVAQSIGQAFQVAYMEYLKANGIEDMSIMKDLDYQEVLNQQEIMGDELLMFARKDCQKEVIVPKQKNEILGIVIVESGWGSMLPTVVVANMMPSGPSARCGHLNIGDQIISVNGISMVGLPLTACQNQIKSTKHLTLVRLVVVPCPPVVEVLIKRPDTKYQLGFSVQDGIICSLLRGGIAERGGVRVGHRIIEINNQSVVATTHDKIVAILANSVGELRMKTMPTQMFRLLTGQEIPVYI